ncbi:hypothetical protein [Zavarzinella formosa]|uniref:hypothetical protein n=1 Tax=Zavarzinella formosa TaxID=360055 RepID=UPI0002DAB3A7|nr:hypothetical protein [Zavarzinella formosa]
MLPPCARDPEGLALLQTCKDNPLDVAPRLILTDWLEDQGEEELAKCLRESLKPPHRTLLSGLAKERWAPLTHCFNGWLGWEGEFHAETLNTLSDNLWLAGLEFGYPMLQAEEAAFLAKKLVPKGLTRLHLSLEDAAATSAVVPVLADKSVSPQLNDLVIFQFETGRIDAIVLAIATSKVLRLDCLSLRGQISDRRIRMLTRFPVLAAAKSLCLSEIRNGDNTAIALARSRQLSNLVELGLTNCGIGVRGIQALAGSPNLGKIVRLDLSSNPIGTVGAESLAASPHIGQVEQLNLRVNQIDAPGVRALGKSPLLSRLTDLDLCHNTIGDTGCRHLACLENFQRLRKLNVSSNQIGSTGMVALAESAHLANLETLDIGGNPIGKAVELVGRFPHLRQLRGLDASDINENGDDLAGAIPSLDELDLERLDLSLNQMNDQGLLAILESRVMANLKHLSFCENDVGDEGIMALARSPAVRNLETLDLMYNQIGDQGFRGLVNSPHLEKLVHLNLCQNQIGDAGAIALANAKDLPNLCTISLDGNPIGEEGRQALATSERLKNVRITL